MTGSRLGVGFIGSGFVAKFHLEAWRGVRDADVLGVWSPKTLTLQYELAASSHGADYHLTVGPGAHADGRLPRPSTRWTGPLSSGRADDLRREGLLDPLA